MLFFASVLAVFILFTVQQISAKCQDDRDPKLTYRILDEFRDERTIVVEGGWIQFTCHSTGVTFHQGYYHPIQSSEDSKIEIRGGKTILEVAIRSSGFFAEKLLRDGDGVYCQCTKNGRNSVWERFKYAVCGHRQHLGELQPCKGNEVCLVTTDRHSVSGRKCGKIDRTTTWCHRDLRKNITKQEYFVDLYYRICGAGLVLSDTECDAVKEALETNDPKEHSPMVQLIRNQTVCEDTYVNFWQGNLTLWHNILFNKSYTFKPRDPSQCKNHRINCHLKLITNQSNVQNESLVGDCSDGWMVSVGQISNYTKSKVVCNMMNSVQILQWHFLLYDTNVTADCINDKVQCTWPLWMGLGTEVLPQNGSCLKKVSFPYPISQKEQVFSVGSDHQPCILTASTTTGDKSTLTVSPNTIEVGNQTSESHPSLTFVSADHMTTSSEMNTFEDSSLSTKSRMSSATEVKTSSTLVEMTSLISQGSTSPWWFWMVIAILGLVLFLGLLGTVLLVFYRRWMSHRNIEITDSDDSVEDSSY